jgi:protein-S-isoprenylcysteine O-methyltransferase Ste14
MIFVDVLIIILLFVLFSLPHSVLASLNFKKKMQERIGTKIAFYRIFYNLFALVSFYLFYIISPKPAVTIYDLDYPFDIAMIFFQVLSLLGLWWSLRPIDLKEFLGLQQVLRYLQNNYSSDELDEKPKLQFEYAFKYVRHPIYFFSILFLGFRPSMDLFYFVMFILIVIYFYVGSIYEEKKLVNIFGVQYVEYQQKVPRMFPIKLFMR